MIKVTYCPVQGEATKRNVLDKTTGFAAEYEREVGSIEGIDTPDITEHKIILGETQYFGVKQKIEEGQLKLKLKEIETEYGKKPEFKEENDGWTWIKEDTVWGYKPVSPAKENEKSGIYWEKKWPKFSESIFDNHVYIGRNLLSMEPLEVGIIRIVGRFWEKEKESNAIITAKYEGQTKTIKIRVIEPQKLLSSEQEKFGDYRYSYDVYGNRIDIDSLCIDYAGKYGIPPQFIKGQIHQESYKKEAKRYWPSFLYEPYTVQIKKGLHEMKKNPFYMHDYSTSNLSFIHQNVKPIYYFEGDTMTVWEVIVKYSQLVNPNAKYFYGARKKDNTMNYFAYDSIQSKYNLFLEEYKNFRIIDKNKNVVSIPLSMAADSANKRMIRYLRDEFKDEVGNKGTINMIAQTRMASSYGLLQMLYTTAILKKIGYKEDATHLPEQLNDTKTSMDLCLNAQKKYLQGKLGIEKERQYNWETGFEKALKDYICKRWNTRSSYAKEVLQKYHLFTPQN